MLITHKMFPAYHCAIIEVDDGSIRQTPWERDRHLVDLDVEIGLLTGNRPIMRVRCWPKMGSFRVSGDSIDIPAFKIEIGR